MKPKTKKTSKSVAHVTEGSGNVFTDLGLPNPEQELLKAQLILQIYTILKDSGMTQVEIAKILGVRQRWMWPRLARRIRSARQRLICTA